MTDLQASNFSKLPPKLRPYETKYSEVGSGVSSSNYFDLLLLRVIGSSVYRMRCRLQMNLCRILTSVFQRDDVPAWLSINSEISTQLVNLLPKLLTISKCGILRFGTSPFCSFHAVFTDWACRRAYWRFRLISSHNMRHRQPESKHICSVDTVCWKAAWLWDSLSLFFFFPSSPFFFFPLATCEITVFTVDANDGFDWEWMLNRDADIDHFFCMIIHVDVDIPYRRCKLLLKCNRVDKFLFILLSKTLNSIKKNIDISCGSPLRFRVCFGCTVCCFVLSKIKMFNIQHIKNVLQRLIYLVKGPITCEM